MIVRRSRLLFPLASLALAGSLLLSGCAPAIEAAQTAAYVSPARTITVVGRGEVKARPDIANTSVGVEVLAPTIEAATTEAEARMAAILAALKELEIESQDIRTSNFSISFERQQGEISVPRVQGAPTDTQSPAGFYRVSNMVQVTIRDLDQVGAVLDAAVKAGANNIWGISFSLADTQALETEAREAAVKDARLRAEALAQLNSVTVTEVIAISEVVGSMPGPVFAEAALRGMGGGGPVEPGELTFSTQIQIVYAIR